MASVQVIPLETATQLPTYDSSSPCAAERLSLQAGHRLAAIAIFATFGAWVLHYQNQSDRWAVIIALARSAQAIGEVPIGCVIVHDPSGRIVGRGFNRRQIDQDSTAHAEMIAIREAGKTLGDWRLIDRTLYVTLEPCPMCAGAIVNARIPRLVYGCADPKAGAVRTLFQLCDDARLNHRVEITSGVRGDECAALLTDFFRGQRALGKK
jgi:tRNA(adenine34) deaminase